MELGPMGRLSQVGSRFNNESVVYLTGFDRDGDGSAEQGDPPATTAERSRGLSRSAIAPSYGNVSTHPSKPIHELQNTSQNYVDFNNILFIDLVYK